MDRHCTGQSGIMEHDSSHSPGIHPSFEDVIRFKSDTITPLFSGENLSQHMLDSDLIVLVSHCVSA